MNTCDTCKWWTDELHNGLQKICKNPKVVIGSPLEKESEATLDDDYAAFIAFSPGPKFGCIQHQSV